MASVGDLSRLAAPFARHLQAENKSLKTIQTYGEAVQQLRKHLATDGIHSADAISREHIEDFIAKLLETRSAATANNRFRALHQFFSNSAVSRVICPIPTRRVQSSLRTSHPHPAVPFDE